MEEIKQILALSKLLEYSSNLKYGIKVGNMTFDDEIGKFAININNRIKQSKGLDIFNKNNSIEQIIQFEHIVSNSISNYTKRRFIKRDVSDEVEILLKSQRMSIEELDKYKILISASLEEEIKKFPELNNDIILNFSKKPEYLSKLAGEEFNNQFFASGEIKIKGYNYLIVSALSHASRKPDELFIISFLLFPFDSFNKYVKNPTQLFLKGLDKYGIDMKIGTEVSRYYYNISVPVDTSVDNVEFLKLQNINQKDSFVVGMSIKHTGFSIELSNVYAINTSKFGSDLEIYFAQK